MGTLLLLLCFDYCMFTCYIASYVFSILHFMSTDVFLGLFVALLKATVATFALHQTISRAAQAFRLTWLLGSPGLAEAAGLRGFAALCGCCGLCLVFVCLVCGVAAAYGATAVLREKQAVLVSGCSGIVVFLGCGLVGTLLGLVLNALIALGAQALSLLGFLLYLGLLNLHQEVKALNPTGLLCLSATIYMVVHLGVCSGPDMFFLLAPFSFLMVKLADLLVFKTTRGHLTLIVLLLIPLTGILLGIDVNKHDQDPLQFFLTGSSAQALCFQLLVVTGATGVLFGGLSLSACEPEREGSVSLWISCPTAALLLLLDGATGWHRDSGAEFGLWSGLSAASGVSLGLAAVSVLKRSFQCLMLVSRMPLDVGRADVRAEKKVSLLMDVTVKLTVLGVVMLGASVLGSVALMTACLGSAGSWAVGGATLLTLLEGIYRVSYE